jgi:hypothetical protein
VAPSSGGWCSIQLSYGRLEMCEVRFVMGDVRFVIVAREKSSITESPITNVKAAISDLQPIMNLRVLPRLEGNRYRTDYPYAGIYTCLSPRSASVNGHPRAQFIADVLIANGLPQRPMRYGKPGDGPLRDGR